MGLKSIAIVGAGIGGLTAALSLQKKGIRVRVYEQASALAEVGAGLHLSPNGIHIIRELDLRPAIQPYDFRPESLVTRHYQTGIPSFELPLDEKFEKEFGTPFIDVHRADLHNALINGVRANDPEAIILNKKLTSIKEGAHQVELTFADGTIEQAETVVAADGVHSIIRSQLYDEPGAVYTGHTAYRGLVSTDAVGKGAIEPAFNIWAGPGKHVVAYYVRRGALLNYVAVVEESNWRTESWTARADKDELVTYFDGWDPVVCKLLAQTQPDTCFKWALLVRTPLQSWSSNRITLLGDAAHPMVPYLAQGAVMAMEDGWVFAHFAAIHDDSATALKGYETARLERTSKVQATAWEQGQKEHGVGTENSDKEFKGGIFSKVSWIYGHNVCELFP